MVMNLASVAAATAAAAERAESCAMQLNSPEMVATNILRQGADYVTN